MIYDANCNDERRRSGAVGSSIIFFITWRQASRVDCIPGKKREGSFAVKKARANDFGSRVLGWSLNWSRQKQYHCKQVCGKIIIWHPREAAYDDCGRSRWCVNAPASRGRAILYVYNSSFFSSPDRCSRPHVLDWCFDFAHGTQSWYVCTSSVKAGSR